MRTLRDAYLSRHASDSLQSCEEKELYVSFKSSSAEALIEDRCKLRLTQIISNRMKVFEERGKPEYPGRNLPEQSREPTNSTHM